MKAEENNGRNTKADTDSGSSRAWNMGMLCGDVKKEKQNFLSVGYIVVSLKMNKGKTTKF